MHKQVGKRANSPHAVPDKLFYKIGEVSRITGVESYVLRYWETEFPFLRPRKNKSGQRVYVKKDIDLILQIKKLLYQERYTIEGVRKKYGADLLRAAESDPLPEDESRAPARNLSDIIVIVKQRLREILTRLQ